MKNILLLALIITSCNYQKRKEVIKKCVITDRSKCIINN